MRITAGNMHFRELNEQIRACPDAEIEIDGCLGQRYIGSGLADKTLLVGGIPGNALGAYLDGGTIVTEGNAQDAAGDTMNDGAIIIHGSCGDGAGYAMRGGKIYIHGDVGYRAGIHMKAYRGKLPVLVVGGTAGSFLGEYQAGGVIVVLGLRRPAGTPLTGYFCGTGMHGGKMFLRCPERPEGLPERIRAAEAPPPDLTEIGGYLDEFCAAFGEDRRELLAERFWVLTPDGENLYRRLYTSV